VRDRIFRSKVIKAYGSQCALTGFKFINGGGRAEVEAAHIKSVEARGPDIVQNGLALSGVRCGEANPLLRVALVHWMFDRGLISLSDDRRIMLSNDINDVDGVRKMLNPDGFARWPAVMAERPDARFLAWHRERCFKGVALG